MSIPTTMSPVGNVAQTEEEKALAAILADPKTSPAVKAFLAQQHKEVARLKAEERRRAEEAALKEAQKNAPFIVEVKEPGVSKNGKNIPAQVSYTDRGEMPWFVKNTEKPTSYWRALFARQAEILAACDACDAAHPQKTAE